MANFPSDRVPDAAACKVLAGYYSYGGKLYAARALNRTDIGDQTVELEICLFVTSWDKSEVIV